MLPACYLDEQDLNNIEELHDERMMNIENPEQVGRYINEAVAKRNGIASALYDLAE